MHWKAKYLDETGNINKNAILEIMINWFNLFLEKEFYKKF